MNKMKSTLLGLVVSTIGLLTLGHDAVSQDYNSTNDGSWTSAANWTNTSGWGASTPSTTNHNSGTANVYHDLTITGNYTLPASVVIHAGAELTVTGNFTKTGGATMHVYGTLYIEGEATLQAPLNIYPGGQVFIDGRLRIYSSQYLVVGTNVASPPFADLVVYGNVEQVNSGDILVRRNGRVAVFGNVSSSSGGGTLFTIEDDGQVYIHGDMTFTGGGDKIVNQNDEDPWGFYVNGTITNTGGGSSTTGNVGTQADLVDDNPDFLDWVGHIPDSPLAILPIKLLYVRVEPVKDRGAKLRWATVMEENFDRFIVERSPDGVQFESIGEVVSQGRNVYDVETRYNFTDDSPRHGWNYYRLKAVDFDLKFEYSRIVSFRAETEKGLWVAPNPTHGQFNLFTDFSVSENDQVVVIDQLGTVILEVAASQARGGIDLRGIARPGIYFVKYSSNQRNHIARVVIR